MAGGRASRGRRPLPLDAADLRGLDRRAGPDAGRRLRPAHRRPAGPRRQAAGGRRRQPSSARCGPLSGTARDGMDTQALRPGGVATPRSIAALLGPDPRVIANEVWAKLMWAGLNLAEDDLPQSQAGNFYPLELVRAVTLAWLFSGQRSDEIARSDGLHPLAARRHRDHRRLAAVLARNAVCLLDVPATRPAPRSPSRSTRCWQGPRRLAGRPPRQPKCTDRRTGGARRPAVRLPGPEDLHHLHQ